MIFVNKDDVVICSRDGTYKVGALICLHKDAKSYVSVKVLEIKGDKAIVGPPMTIPRKKA